MSANGRSRLPLVNAASNTLALVAFLAVQFFLTPVTLEALGKTRYGVWSFVESFIAPGYSNGAPSALRLVPAV